MIYQDEDAQNNGPKYASLTAGLLARKGEAVPAAAAFTAEAIAQHIPARRLAQEAERELVERHPIVDSTIEDRPTVSEATGHEERGSEIVAKHRELIEQAFDEETASKTEEPEKAAPGIEELLDPALESVGETRLPGVDDARILNLPDVQKSDSAGGDGDHYLFRAAPETLNADDEADGSWFEEIVSSAIKEAEGNRPQASAEDSGESDSSQEDGPVEGSLASLDFARHMESDREMASEAGENTQEEPEEREVPEGAVPLAAAELTAAGGCGDKAAKVRNAIRSGSTARAAKSAMKLDPRRFIRLSLAAQKLQLNNQELMIAALDSYLDALDEEVFSDCSCIQKGLI